jgi:WD40 repeat protein
MSSFVRECKLRQSAVTVTKKEQHYENLKTFQLQTDVNGISANSLFLAYADTTGTGSALAVLLLSSTGKNHVPISSPAYAQPIIRAHGQSVQDFEFNPFDPHQLYSCSTDKTVKLWQIPEDGLVVDMSAPAATLSLEDQAPVRGLAVHPTVNGLLAARGSRSFSIFDVNSGNALSSLTTKGTSPPTADFFSVAWSGDGQYLVTLAKDKLLRVHDPRAVAEAVMTATAHTGLRFARSVWLGDSPFLVTCGHSSSQEREFMLWDSRNLAGGCVKRERIDAGYGPLLPLYDADLNALVIMGKGDNSFRLYDVDSLNSSSETLGIHGLSNHTVTAGGSDTTKGACLLPKQANDLMACEVMRVLKLSEGVIQPISVTVPRKEKLKFHEDLFPPTVCEASPSMTVEEYLGGENRPLSRVPLVPRPSRGSVNFSSAPSPAPDSGDADAVSATQPTSQMPAGEGDHGPSTSEVASRSESPVPMGGDNSRAVSKRFSSLTSNSKFRHMYGTENTKENSYFNLAPDLSAMDSPIVACNETYFAIPHRAGGKPCVVYSSNLNGAESIVPVTRQQWAACM